MSSSRSIAAARQRRSGDVVQKPVNLSSAQQQRQQMLQRPGSSGMPQRGMPQKQQPMMQQQQQQQPIMQQPQQIGMDDLRTGNPKISIGAAIGLTTLRLGKLEQIVNALTSEGGLPSGGILPDNSKIVDNTMLTSLMSRIDNLEKSQTSLKSLESEIKFTKDLLMNLKATVDQVKSEMDERFNDYEVALSNIENTLNYDQNDLHAEPNFALDLAEEVNDEEGISIEVSE